MAWEQLSINKPHLVYIILGGFTSLFMLCSSIIKERLYIGEATVATICGIIFGPHAANLINPDSWGNVDQITLEFSRIVLVVQCFAVGVELPKYYMERHWKSVVFLLVPVMTFGWMVTSLFIWAMFYDKLNWLDSLVCAACVTATDPVLASSVVGKGKFAKRVPKHLRDLLSAESGCNDGMAFPFIYLGIYLVRYRPDTNEVALHWFCLTILYECIFGAVYGVTVGYCARRAIRYAHERDLIDRESFLVFYFVLALFCAGSGSLLGMDDLLIGFACGVGFSNDGWFLEKTEESHVSNVIDLLINLAFFVYFGTIIPWNLYASEVIGTSPWQLVVIAVLVIFFRRIPIMLALKPFIPDIKTWREALFAGHFGPIGVGALFVAILARAEFETETTTPLAHIPPPHFKHRHIIELIWPITTFLVITSIIVHGSSVAVFTLGRHINTLTFTMSYTRGNDESTWMDRLPRIQSRSKSSMSLQKGVESSQDDLEKLQYPEPTMGHPNAALNLPRIFLRRQREEDNPSRASSVRPSSRRKWDSGIGPGGHVEDSAITPISRAESLAIPTPEKIDSDSTAVSSDESPRSEKFEDKANSADASKKPEAEVFEEGDNDVVEDEEGNVLSVVKSPESETEKEKEKRLGEEAARAMEEEDVEDGVAQTQHTEAEQGTRRRFQRASQNSKDDQLDKSTGMGNMMRKLSSWGDSMKASRAASRRPSQPTDSSQETPKKSVPARAFRFGNTVIVEDEDGEVIKKYDLAERSQRPSYVDRQRIHKWIKGRPADPELGDQSREEDHDRGDGPGAEDSDSNDSNGGGNGHRMRFNIEGRRLSKAEFIRQIQSLNAQDRPQVINENEQVRQNASQAGPQMQRNQSPRGGRPSGPRQASQIATQQVTTDQQSEDMGRGDIPQRIDAVQIPAPTTEDLQRLDSAYGQEIPVHSLSEDLRQHAYRNGQAETGADMRRRLVSQPTPADTQVVGSETAADRRRRLADGSSSSRSKTHSSDHRSERVARESGAQSSKDKSTTGSYDVDETPAERRRREGALGISKEDSESEDESQPRQPPKGNKSSDAGETAFTAPTPTGSSIRFADQAGESRPKFGNIRWASSKGR